MGGTSPRAVDQGPVHPMNSNLDQPCHMKVGSSRESLPSSVRNAPSGLRAAIRRKQNNESAKRCRERRNVEREMVRARYEESVARIARIESVLEEISATTGNKAAADAVQRSRRIADGSARNRASDPSKFYGDPF